MFCVTKIGQFEIQNGLSLATAIDRDLLRDKAFHAPCREVFSVIHSLNRLGRPWDRGRRCGPQFGEWEFQQNFARKLTAISGKRLGALEAELESEGTSCLQCQDSLRYFAQVARRMQDRLLARWARL